jgi:DNA repair protein RadD
LELRPYQEKIVSKARSLMQKGVRSMLITSPTGSGKTVLVAHMLKASARRGLPSWFINHRRELVKQSIKTFGVVGVNHGVIAAGFHEDLTRLMQIGSVQTLSRRFHKLRAPSLIIWDECHHVAAGSWAKIFRAFPNAFHIGLTATPERLDGKGLGEYFQEMIAGPTVEWLIENRYLSPYRIFAPPGGIDVSGVRKSMGDFSRQELQVVASRPTITGSAIQEYKKRADGKRAVVFCVSVEHSKHVVEEFKAAGIPAAHVDGETDVSIRDETIRRFERGDIRVLSNVELFGEGFDLPAMEVAILLRPTQSLGLYLQQVGRVLRPSPGKTEAIILDHAGNCERHGLPDETREWSLQGRSNTRGGDSKDGTSSVRICPQCFAAQFRGRDRCGFCQHQFEVQSRKVDEVEGELIEGDPAALRLQKRREQKSAESLEDLIQLGIKRGYKRPQLWAQHVFNARQVKRLKDGAA